MTVTKECYFCGRDVDPAGPFTYRLVMVWQRPDRKLSKLRSARDRYACDSCVTRKERGINPTQGSLI
jgi:hypothetical protein